MEHTDAIFRKANEEGTKRSYEKVYRYFAALKKKAVTDARQYNSVEEQNAYIKLFEEQMRKAVTAIRELNNEVVEVVEETEEETEATKKSTDAILENVKARKALHVEYIEQKKDLPQLDVPDKRKSGLSGLIDDIVTDTEEAKAKRKQQQQDAIQAAVTMLDAIQEVYDEAAEKKQQMQDKEIQASEKHQSDLENLARKGIEGAADNLAFEQKKQAELELQKAKDEKKIQQAKLAMEFVSVYASYAQDDPKTALTNTMKDIIVIKQAVKGLSSLDKGIENTNDANQSAQVGDGKQGFLSVLHPNEKVIRSEHTKMIGNVSNEKLAQLAQDYRTGNNWQSNSEILHKFDKVENAIKNIQTTKFEFDELNGMVTTIVETRNKKVKMHKKTGGLFN